MLLRPILLELKLILLTILYQETAFSSPTSVFVSQSAGEAPLTPESVKLSSSEEEQYSPFEDDVNPTALFNLWTGRFIR